MRNNQTSNAEQGMEQYFFRASAADFKKIPGSPIAYWVSEKMLSTFEFRKVRDYFITREGMATADNDRFLRLWHEVQFSKVCLGISSRKDAIKRLGKWFPYNKGGEFRKWYGNNDLIVEYANDGYNIKNNIDPQTGRVRSHNYNGEYAFKEGLTWSAISSGSFSIRYSPAGFLFDSKGAKGFTNNHLEILAFLNSKLAAVYLEILSPTLDYKVGDVIQIPFELQFIRPQIINYVPRVMALSRADWDSYETSWDFKSLPLLDFRFEKPGQELDDNHQPSKIVNRPLSEAYAKLRAHWQSMTAEMQRLEEENNRIFIEAYGLQDELTPEVPLEEITLTCNPRYRYGGGKTDAAYEQLQRTDTMKELISYAIGCMMGRYSLDTPGLQFAGGEYDHAEACRMAPSFPPDADGILPVLSDAYFEEDATGRFMTFLATAFGRESLTQNAQFLANALGSRGNESPQATIRRYLADTFFKDHLRTYKKRPIYWLFSSGKLKAFQALVYMHRYTPSTLARMRTNYLHPLQNKLRARIDDLEDAAETSGTKTDRNLPRMRKQLEELRQFDEKLHHYADLRIAIDLDDGVKHNYGLFGDLLVEVKSITGTTQNDS